MSSTEAARAQRANKAMDAKPCPACGQPLHLGDDVLVCNACGAAHHAGCWTGRGGCGTLGCGNAPLETISGLAPPPVVPPGAYHPGPPAVPPTADGLPPHAGGPYAGGGGPYAGAGGAYAGGAMPGPRPNAPGAVASLVMGLVGLFVCGPILGSLAITRSGQAKKAIAAAPGEYGGEGMATAGMVLGIVDIVLWVLIIIGKVAGTK